MKIHLQRVQLSISISPGYLRVLNPKHRYTSLHIATLKPKGAPPALADGSEFDLGSQVEIPMFDGQETVNPL